MGTPTLGVIILRWLLRCVCDWNTNGKIIRTHSFIFIDYFLFDVLIERIRRVRRSYSRALVHLSLDLDGKNGPNNSAVWSKFPHDNQSCLLIFHATDNWSAKYAPIGQYDIFCLTGVLAVVVGLYMRLSFQFLLIINSVSMVEWTRQISFICHHRCMFNHIFPVKWWHFPHNFINDSLPYPSVMDMNELSWQWVRIDVCETSIIWW